MQSKNPPQSERQLVLTCSRENGRLVVRVRDDLQLGTIRTLRDSLTRYLNDARRPA